VRRQSRLSSWRGRDWLQQPSKLVFPHLSSSAYLLALSTVSEASAKLQLGRFPACPLYGHAIIDRDRDTLAKDLVTLGRLDLFVSSVTPTEAFRASHRHSSSFYGRNEITVRGLRVPAVCVSLFNLYETCT